MTKLLLILLLSTQALAAGHRPPPRPEPSVVPSPSPSPSNAPEKPKLFVTLDETGSTWEKKQAREAIATMDETVSSGCLKTKALMHDGFRSFNTVFEVSPKTALAAYNEFVAGAPYRLTVRTYYTRSKVYGYTYNFRDDDWNGASETRVWTNTRYSWTADELAAHWFHEKSHQANAGGFVHYTVHQGSFPYEIGDLAAECIAEKRSAGRIGMMSVRVKARARGELAP